MKCYYHPENDAVGQCSRCGKFACRTCIEDVGGAMLCTACQRLAEAEAEAEQETETRRTSDKATRNSVAAFALALLGGFGGGWIAVDAWTWEAAVLAIPGFAYLGWGLAWGWPPVWRKWRDTLGGRHWPSVPFMWVMTLLFWFIPLSIAIGYGCLGGGIKRYLRAREDVRKAKAADVAKQAKYDAVNVAYAQEQLDASERALALRLNDASAWEEKGFALLRLRRYQEAWDAFDRATTLAPEKAVSWCGKGFALNDLGRYEDALVAFDHALTIDPDMDNSWDGRRVACMKLHRYREAWHAFNKGTAL